MGVFSELDLETSRLNWKKPLPNHPKYKRCRQS